MKSVSTSYGLGTKGHVLSRSYCIPPQVGVSDWSAAGEDGIEEADPLFPYRLRFHPTGNISFPHDFQRYCQISEFCDVVTIPAGSTLHQIFALDKPEEMGGTEQLIGELVLTRKISSEH